MARSVRRGGKAVRRRWWPFGRRLELDALSANDGWYRDSEDVWKALPR